MRIAVDIPDDQLAEIDAIATALDISRTEFIQRSIAASIAPSRNSADTDAFGILEGKLPDGLAYQKKFRNEW